MIEYKPQTYCGKKVMSVCVCVCERERDPLNKPF